MNESIVTLEKYELYLAAIVGVRRHIYSLESKEMNKVNNPKFNWSSDIEGACGEMAVAKFLGVYWDGSVNTFKAADIKPDIQVRHTEKEDGNLIVRPKDSADERYVLVVGKWGSYEIKGWILGKDAKVPENKYQGFNGMPDAWFVPQCRLIDINLITKGDYHATTRPEGLLRQQQGANLRPQTQQSPDLGVQVPDL